jgi:ribonuclease D
VTQNTHTSDVNAIIDTGVNHKKSSMPYPPPETASRDEIVKILDQLKLLLMGLPLELP